MYLYVYDAFLNHRRYDRILSEIETRLNEIGINGKINRLSVLTNMKDTIENGIRHGAKTVVIVGNDHTFSEAANTLAQFPKIVLGFLPIGSQKENMLAAWFRIPIGVKSCDTLSARIIQKIPLGKINNHFFLICAQILSPGVTLLCDDKYKLQLRGKKGMICIYNTPPHTLQEEKKSHTLQTVVEQLPGIFSFRNKKYTVDSIFFHTKISISSKEAAPIIIDDNQKINSPAEISVASEKIQLIVGKNY